MVRVYSRLLEETIECVEDGHGPSDDLDTGGGPPRVLYTRSEVIALQHQPADALRAVHEVKKHFGGRYVGPSPRQ